MELALAAIGAALGTAGFIVSLARWRVDESRLPTPGTLIATSIEGDTVHVTFRAPSPLYDVVILIVRDGDEPVPFGHAHVLDSKTSLVVSGPANQLADAWFLVDFTIPQGGRWRRIRLWSPYPEGYAYWKPGNQYEVESERQYLRARLVTWFLTYVMRKPVGPGGVLRRRLSLRQARRLIQGPTTVQVGRGTPESSTPPGT